MNIFVFARRCLLAVLAGSLAIFGRASAPGAEPTLVVACKWADSVQFLDSATGQLQQTVEIGRRPHEMVVAADGRRAYLSLYGIDFYYDTAEGGRAVAILDVHQRRKLGEIDLARYRRPHGLELGRASGKLYVTCDHPAALLILDVERRAIDAAIELSDAKSLPHMVAVSHDERWAYVANSGNGTVSFIDLTTKKESSLVQIGGVPMGIALTADGKTLYATNRTANGVAVIDTAEPKMKRIIELAGQPVRCHLMPDESKLVVTLIESGEIAIVDVPSLAPERRLAAGSRVEGLLVSPDGRYVYASAQADNQVIKFSTMTWEPILKLATAPRPDPLVLIPVGTTQRSR